MNQMGIDLINLMVTYSWEVGFDNVNLKAKNYS